MGARLKFWRRSCVPKKGSRGEAVEGILAASPLVTAPPSNLTRLLYNTASYAGYFPVKMSFYLHENEKIISTSKAEHLTSF